MRGDSALTTRTPTPQRNDKMAVPVLRSTSRWVNNTMAAKTRIVRLIIRCFRSSTSPYFWTSGVCGFVRIIMQIGGHRWKNQPEKEAIRKEGWLFEDQGQGWTVGSNPFQLFIRLFRQTAYAGTWRSVSSPGAMHLFASLNHRHGWASSSRKK